MNFDIIQLTDLVKEAHVPNTVEDQVEEIWFVKFGEEVVGVGLFYPTEDQCKYALVGDNDADKITLGRKEPDEDQLIYESLAIVFETYLRSIKGDTAIGELKID